MTARPNRTDVALTVSDDVRVCFLSLREGSRLYWVESVTGEGPSFMLIHPTIDQTHCRYLVCMCLWVSISVLSTQDWRNMHIRITLSVYRCEHIFMCYYVVIRCFYLQVCLVVCVYTVCVRLDCMQMSVYISLCVSLVHV